MPCLCTTNTLRLFVRSVAQVDLPSSTIRASSQQWQRAAIRSLSSTRRVHEPPSIATASTLASKQDIPFDLSPPGKQNPKVGPKSWPKASAEDIQLVSDAKTEAESAPVKKPKKLSKVAVRKLERYGLSDTDASDGKSEAQWRRGEVTPGKRARLSTVVPRKDPSAMPIKKKERHEKLVAEIKPIIRRTDTENTSLAIHYSAPRASLKAAPAADSKQGTKSKAKPTNSAIESDEWKPPPREHWQIDKEALKEKFPEGWKPLKKLSPDAMNGIRALHAQSPEQYTTKALADSFKISPEAIRRILKSKWSPDSEEETERQDRWLKRGKIIYTKHAELGQKPPKKWRDMGIGKGKPEWMLRKKKDRERAPLPALITTSRAKQAKYGSNGASVDMDSLENRIL